jgi:four helix bundle protein
MDLTDAIFLYNKDLPNSERYNLIDQMNRSSCSIPANIAEGSGKRSKLQFSEFLSIALTSAFELETQLLICERRKYGKAANLEQALSLVNEVQKMIFIFRELIINQK